VRHVVGTVAARQHQLVDRNGIGLGRRPSPRRSRVIGDAEVQVVGPADRKFRSPPLYGMVSISRSAGAAGSNGQPRRCLRLCGGRYWQAVACPTINRSGARREAPYRARLIDRASRPGRRLERPASTVEARLG
jgi:hypothetical protein